MSALSGKWSAGTVRQTRKHMHFHIIGVNIVPMREDGITDHTKAWDIAARRTSDGMARREGGEATQRAEGASKAI